MAKKHIKKCATPLAIREIQIKTTLRFHLTPVRLAKIKNTKDCSCWQGYRVRGTFIHGWLECKLWLQLWKSMWCILRNVRIDLPPISSCTTFVHTPKKLYNLLQKHLLIYVDWMQKTEPHLAISHCQMKTPILGVDYI